ncbi:aldo/keto reductase [Nonomuraea jabiensis]|uniref:aldo/keto reductase n=1 Tax=Nonomuraea jabiensis TaxID=882448 RepID=UPI003D73D696
MTTPASLPQRTLGRCGITVPAVGIGCWAIGGPDDNLGLPMGWSTGASAAQAAAGLETAWERGARLFDTADVYGHGRSERLLGGLVARVPRDEIVLVSKVGYFAGTAEHGFEPRHMRRQLEQTLDNLRTDRLDIYFLHHSEFGPDDRWLKGAVEAMRSFHEEGLIRAVGMRGPHRFALDRLTVPADQRGDKIARFRAVFETVQPDVLAVRDNLLSPHERSEGIFAFAREQQVGVLINKPLSQGLLTGAYDPHALPLFGPGDHRLRKRWFQSDAVKVIDDGLQELQSLVGWGRQDLIRIALWACLDRYAHAAVLTGYTRAEQVAVNLSCLGQAPPPDVIAQARDIMGRVQTRLDQLGEVFIDETTKGADRP